MEHGFSLDEAFTLPPTKLTAFYIAVKENNGHKFNFQIMDWENPNEKV